MRRPLSRVLILSAVVAISITLSGCVGLSSTGSKQNQSMGSVTLTFSACANGSPGCSAPSNTGSVYDAVNLGNSSVEGQALAAVRLPDGPTPPQQLTAALGGGGSLTFNRSLSYETQLQQLEPAPPGEKWWGWLSDKFTYSETSKQSFTISITVDPPSLAEGPLPSPMHWRPVVGSRGVESGLPNTRPVICGQTTDDLYNGYSETGNAGSTIACIDSPDAGGARGFLGAPITDFGLTGTTVTVPAGGTVSATFLARRSGTGDPSTTFSLSAATGVPGGSVSIDRSSVLLAGDSTQPVLATIGVPAGTAPGSYPVTLTATAPGKPTRNATVTVVVPGDPNEAPRIKAASLTRQRFAARKPKGTSARSGAPVGAKLKVTLSERATLSVKIEKGKRQPRKRLGTPVKVLPQGQSTIPVGGKLLGVKLTPGRYRITLTAKDGGGLSSAPKTLSFSLVR